MSAIVGYIPSSFGLGFAAGGLLFAYWDVISSLFGRLVLKKEVFKPSIRPWIGRIDVDLKDDGRLELWIHIVNVGHVPFRITKIEGNCKLCYTGGDNRRYKSELPTPLIQTNPTVDNLFQHGIYGALVIEQKIPDAVSRNFPEAFSWKPYPFIEFSGLDIFLQSDTGEIKRTLPMWDSLRLSTGDTQIRSVETFKLFPDEETRNQFNESLNKISQWFQNK